MYVWYTRSQCRAHCINWPCSRQSTDYTTWCPYVMYFIDWLLLHLYLTTVNSGRALKTLFFLRKNSKHDKWDILAGIFRTEKAICHSYVWVVAVLLLLKRRSLRVFLQLKSMVCNAAFWAPQDFLILEFLASKDPQTWVPKKTSHFLT